MPSLHANASPATPLDWSPPGPGQWSLDRSHYPGGTTLISQWLIETGLESGTRRVFAELGAPVGAISVRFVRGFNYSRTVPLVGANRCATKLPPTWVLKAASRLHPEFRRRAQSAKKALANPPGLEAVRRWTEHFRPLVHQRNNEFAATDLKALSDGELAAHCRSLLDHLHSMSDLHFWLHGYDLGPIARYVAFTVSHGIPTAEAVAALEGASPSTLRPREHLAEIRAALGDARPTNLAELRNVSADVASMLDAYLAEHGSTLVTGYDLTALTLAELPETLFETIMRTSSPARAGGSGSGHDNGTLAAQRLRARVPETLRADFDSRLHEARDVMDMRDDNGPTVLGRPTGLLRLALLELGHRLVARGSATQTDHAFGGAPILTHAADAEWISRPGKQITTWTGDEHRLSPTVRLIHCPGHFPGSAVLHWTAAPNGKRVLLAGDSIHVAADRRHVTVMYSVPNYIPVDASTINDIKRRLAELEFDDVYGFTWGLNIIGNARHAVDQSLDRYLTAIGSGAATHGE